MSRGPARKGLSTPAFTAVVALILLSSVGIREVVRAVRPGVLPAGTTHGIVAAGAEGAAPADLSAASSGVDTPNVPGNVLGAKGLWAVLGPAMQSLEGTGRLEIPVWSRLPVGLGGFAVLVKMGGEPHRWVRTNATSVGQLLDALDVDLKAGELVRPSASEPLASAMTILIDQVRRADVTLVERAPFDTVTRYTTSLSPGESREVQAGAPGQTLRTFRITYRNDKEVGRKLLSVVVLTDPVSRVVEKGASGSSAGSYSPPLGSGGAAAAVAAAYSAIGVPYVNGGASLSGFDCSGLTMWAWAHGGVSLPHSAASQYYATRRVASSDLQPGDLVFFYSPISHVAIYVGGGQMIMAHTTGTYVQLDYMSSYWWGVYSGAGRP